MASAQIYRFQQRITNLQLHHELASVRHCEAVSNYINQNNELMNALMAHLKAPDKGMKRTKRLTKPRTTTTPHTTQLAKSARFTGKSYATQSSHVEQLTTTHHHHQHHQQQHHSLGKKTDFVNQQCLPEDAWNNNSSNNTNNNYHHYSYYTTTPVIHNDDHFTCNSKEPIFPPPTYLESSFNCESNRLDNTADDNNCLWKDIWHENPRNTGSNSSSSSNSSSNNPNVFFQKNHASRTPQTNYTLCDKLFPPNDDNHDDGTQSFMYNNNNIDAQEKHHHQQPQYCWSRDNVSLDDHSKQHTLNRSILPDYHLPVITQQQQQQSSSSDSYWLKQSTSYTDELKSPIIPFNRNEYFHYSEPLLCAVQNNIDSKHGNSVPISQMTNNNHDNHYSTEFSTFNSSYELTGLSKSHINPILASTYPSNGSGGHTSRSTMFFNTDQSLKPYYDCQSYHPSGSNGDNNVSSSSSSNNNNDNRSTSNYCIYQTNRP
ncbi:unnamed protein product [Schistosoma turkestanicum]|nr:unnamed protein product [Schistosoma turkestanicum]